VVGSVFATVAHAVTFGGRLSFQLSPGTQCAHAVPDIRVQLTCLTLPTP
jgi:hypothetical protein